MIDSGNNIIIETKEDNTFYAIENKLNKLTIQVPTKLTHSIKIQLKYLF